MLKLLCLHTDVLLLGPPGTKKSRRVVHVPETVFSIMVTISRVKLSYEETYYGVLRSFELNLLRLL